MSARKEQFLWVLFQGRPVGRVIMERHGRVRLVYEASWQRSESALPLSLSLPLVGGIHPHEPVARFLAGLLPDRPEILDAWARRFHASRHPFSLLGHVGEDCPGAFQFVRPERLDELLSADPFEVDWLDHEAIGERVRALRADPAAWRAPGDAGQFSLGGAQAKTSLLLHEGRWGIPSGRTPTTHILKPSIPGFDGHAVNEHVCLELARALGLPTASSEIRRFGDEIVIVVERYDRARTAGLAQEAAAEAARWAAPSARPTDRSAPEDEGISPAGAAARAAARARALESLGRSIPILRLHQEDMCQALAVPPHLKYENAGGPSVRGIVGLIRTHSSRADDDVWTFIDALSFNWLVGGTDAHAKNYSVLHGSGGRVRLAPFYDLASILPYEAFARADVTLSMKIGGTYRLSGVDRDAWLRLAVELKIRPDDLLQRLGNMAENLPSQIEAVGRRAREEEEGCPIVNRMVEVLSERAQACARELGGR